MIERRMWKRKRKKRDNKDRIKKTPPPPPQKKRRGIKIMNDREKDVEKGRRIREEKKSPR